MAMLYIPFPVHLRKLTYKVGGTNNNHSSRLSNYRINKIIWFNPPFCKFTHNSIGKYFINLLDRHFNKDNSLSKNFNRNAVKISFSCKNDMYKILNNHNRRLLTETDINTRLAKAQTVIHSLSVIWKSDLTDKMKRSFFQAAVALILLYGCTTWTLTKLMEKKLDGNNTRMLRAILNKSWRQHPTKQQLYGHLTPNTKAIPDRRTRHAGHCWKSSDELISNILQWTPVHGRIKAG